MVNPVTATSELKMSPEIRAAFALLTRPHARASLVAGRLGLAGGYVEVARQGSSVGGGLSRTLHTLRRHACRRGQRRDHISTSHPVTYKRHMFVPPLKMASARRWCEVACSVVKCDV